ncbi:MAG: hypothetical protein J6X18_08995 [Bacteroidales bacterium]|nr:hypothetical protein [Bacteroidales bacterium]
MTNNKNITHLTEEQFKQIVQECTVRILNEGVDEGALWNALKGTFQGIRDVNQANRQDRRDIRTAEKNVKYQQKSFDKYMAQADKDIEVLTKMLQRYQQDPNAGNIVDKLSRAIGAIRPKNTQQANKNSYFQQRQNQLDNARAQRDKTTATAKQNIQQRGQNVQRQMRNTFSGQNPEQYDSAVAE